jgi:hypothetical protein
MAFSNTTNYKLYQIAKNIHIQNLHISFKNTLTDIKGVKNYIINTDQSDGNGIHWVALVILNNKGYYFNSLNVNEYPDIDNFEYDALNEVIEAFPNIDIIDVDEHIQNHSSGWCGIYCLYFIWFMNKYSINSCPIKVLERFKNIWNEDPEKNLRILKKNFKNIENPNYFIK